jgi:hypothetical protein
LELPSPNRSSRQYRGPPTYKQSSRCPLQGANPSGHLQSCDVRPRTYGKKSNNNNNAIMGTLTGDGSLQAARQQKLASPDGGLFVTKLKPGTQFQDVKSHIFRRCGLQLRCVPIRSRNDHLYASFRVLCNAYELKKLYVAEMWPKGSLVCEFHSRSISS